MAAILKIEKSPTLRSKVLPISTKFGVMTQNGCFNPAGCYVFFGNLKIQDGEEPPF